MDAISPQCSCYHGFEGGACDKCATHFDPTKKCGACESGFIGYDTDCSVVCKHGTASPPGELYSNWLQCDMQTLTIIILTCANFKMWTIPFILRCRSSLCSVNMMTWLWPVEDACEQLHTHCNTVTSICRAWENNTCVCYMSYWQKVVQNGHHTE